MTAHLREEGDDLVLDYVMDMREANDPAFVEKLQRLRDEGHPINWADVTHRLAQGTFGRTMDLTRFGFRRSKVAMS